MIDEKNKRLDLRESRSNPHNAQFYIWSIREAQLLFLYGYWYCSPGEIVRFAKARSITSLACLS